MNYRTVKLQWDNGQVQCKFPCNKNVDIKFSVHGFLEWTSSGDAQNRKIGKPNN